jgi:serine/threonine-protein kinase
VDQGVKDLWLCDLKRGTERRFTEGKGPPWFTAWTPDGRRVVYNLHKNDTLNLYWKPVDGSAPEEVLVDLGMMLQPGSFSADGELFAFQSSDDPETGFDLWVLPMTGDNSPEPFLQTDANELHPVFSPDSRWLAYASNETGQYEVYVRPYPGPGGVMVVSSGGGFEPVWGPDGSEIFYRSVNGRRVTAVAFDLRNGRRRVGNPELLFEGDFANGFTYGRMYDISPDGQRFLMVYQEEPPPPPTQYNVVLNWFGELKRLTGVSGGS